jgi:hypothetical protein
MNTDKKCCITACMTHCPITKVFLPRFIPAMLAAFIFIAVYEYIIHGLLLTDIYAQTPQLWRSVEDMQDKLVASLLFQGLTAYVIGLIFTRYFENKGAAEGLRFGMLIGLLIGVGTAASYSWMPVSSTLAVIWFFTGLGKGIGIGLLFGLIYRDPCCVSKSSCCGDGSCGKGECKCKNEAGKTGCCDTTAKTSSCSTTGATKTGCC